MAISVEDAIASVIKYVDPLTPKIYQLKDSLGLTNAADVVCSQPFPAFPTSIMDGFAGKGPLLPGIYKVQDDILAGRSQSTTVESGSVVYITTGAMIPNNTDAVVKVEDTEPVVGNERSEVKYVNIHSTVSVNSNIRNIGSDIQEGELVLQKGEIIGPAEIGILSTIGVHEVLCFQKPIIGVMSTGNELVEPWEIPHGSQIRDCNRPALIAAFLEMNYHAIDLGIVKDSKDEIREKLIQAARQCDVVVTSGGVSMGSADYVKPLLSELGTIHFGKLNMKPGKPTTFATVLTPMDDQSPKKSYFFGLPGNPVSCLVTKSLFVDTALRRLQGLKSMACLHTQLKVKLIGSSIILDPERPEYHRAELKVDMQSGAILAKSTGNQRSSRLLSMKSANGLLCLPQGLGEIKEGAELVALLVRPLPAASIAPNTAHLKAAFVDFSITNLNTKDESKVKVTSESLEVKGEGWRTIRVGLLTISDRASQGIYPDESGPMMAKLLMEMSQCEDWPLVMSIADTEIIPDEPDMIQSIIKHWSDATNPLDLILTSGGTGFGVRDHTPEAVKPLLHREAPGVAQALINEGLKYTPLAVISRPVVGTRYSTFICTLPGSVKAVKENIACLKILFPRIFELLKNGECSMKPK